MKTQKFYYKIKQKRSRKKQKNSSSISKSAKIEKKNQISHMQITENQIRSNLEFYYKFGNQDRKIRIRETEKGKHHASKSDFSYLEYRSPA